MISDFPTSFLYASQLKDCFCLQLLLWSWVKRHPVSYHEKTAAEMEIDFDSNPFIPTVYATLIFFQALNSSDKQ